MHILSTKDLNTHLPECLDLAASYKKLDQDRFKYGRYGFDSLKGRVIATLFFEPSTRTRLSFEAAAVKLGAHAISCSEHGSSLVKGESISDTVRTVAEYSDLIVLRSPFPVSDLNLLSVGCPVINAGDGSHQHPTQALLDAFTVREHFGRLTNLRMLVIGDLHKSRAIRSFVEFFGGFHNNSICVYDSIGHSGSNFGIPCWVEANTETQLMDAFGNADVVYLNRVQTERHELANTFRGHFALNQEHLDRLPATSCILNPGPRREEQPSAFDSDSRVLYFQQAANGMYVRMALLACLLLEKPETIY